MPLNSHRTKKKNRKPWRRIFWALIAFALLIVQQRSAIHPDDCFPQQAGLFIAGRYFDFVGWELNAAGLKVAQAAAHTHWQLDDDQRSEMVTDYVNLVRQIHDLEHRIRQQYTTLAGQTLTDAARPLEEELTKLRQQQNERQPLVEAILEEQITTILTQEGFAPAGLLFPPLRFHFTQTPLYLIISPRDEIKTKYGTMLRADMPLEDQIALEENIDRALDVSSLVDKVGGLGIYPTMVIESSYLPWIVDTIAHEWSHNYLFLRPLGWHYGDSGQMTTINETVASIFGQEICRKVLARYYPELEPPHIKRRHNIGWEPPPEDPGSFDFGREMRETRLRVDELLGQGKIKEAESYMETRRQIFVEHGYTHLRKLNQAYFAFHGSYATAPGAVDPIGPLLKRLRLRHDSLKSFIDALQNVTSYQELEQILAAGN
ncbi:MAG: hypothetical protein B6I34_06705 [Anaerolineaceae bacterium 4572_32.1]|nr:MAG: hypothetical protein B6I34_06705 [Anaerolineaceae bacterium 4572_32.1]